jgi:hypothetical protein
MYGFVYMYIHTHTRTHIYIEFKDALSCLNANYPTIFIYSFMAYFTVVRTSHYVVSNGNMIND